MRRMSRFLSGAVLAALCGPGKADAEEPAMVYKPLSSGQINPGPGPAIPSAQSLEAGAGGSMPGASGGMAGTPGATNPDGTPIAAPGDGAGSGAFAGDTGGGAGAAGAGAGGGGFSPGLGGTAGASLAPPGVIGDMSPISNFKVSAAASTRFPVLPTPVPPPHVPGNNPGIVSSNGTASVLFKLTGLKISDNQSPVPQDRFFTSFNYFDNLNASVNRREMSPVQNLQVYHELFGLEKTIFDGRASIGFRMPLNTISLKSTANVAGLGGSSTAPGDLSLFFKYALYRDDQNLISTGLQVQAPTGPGAFGGNKYYSYFRDTQLQPFVGYLFRRDRFYMQGFFAVNVPTMSQDVTLMFNDFSIGYYVYRPDDPNKFITAIIPTAEAHLTTPLNHRGFSSKDLASTPDILNMTFGTNIEIRKRSIISVAYVTPVTGPKPFNAELVVLFNYNFGKLGRGRLPFTPPVQ